MADYYQPGLDGDDEENKGAERSVLPPGLDSTEDRPQGLLTLTVKKLLWMNIKVSLDHVRLKPVFWGQKPGDPEVMLRAANAGPEVNRTVKRRAEFEVR